MTSSSRKQSLRVAQAAFRSRKAAAGESEVRGIFAPTAMHVAIKKAVAEMLASDSKGKTDGVIQSSN
jgi:hypothetical protein